MQQTRNISTVNRMRAKRTNSSLILSAWKKSHDEFFFLRTVRFHLMWQRSSRSFFCRVIRRLKIFKISVAHDIYPSLMKKKWGKVKMYLKLVQLWIMFFFINHIRQIRNRKILFKFIQWVGDQIRFYKARSVCLFVWKYLRKRWSLSTMNW